MSKKRSGCCLGKLTRVVLYFICFAMVVAMFSSIGDTDTTNTSQATAPASSTVTPSTTKSPTIAPTDATTAEPTTEPFEILLKWPDLGEYGEYYTFNEKVKKAEESDKETIIQCYVPAGVYTVTNVDHSPWSFVYVYSRETVISEYGWEEPADTWVSPKLEVGDSCEVTIPEGWYINLQQNDTFRLIRK